MELKLTWKPNLRRSLLYLGEKAAARGCQSSSLGIQNFAAFLCIFWVSLGEGEKMQFDYPGKLGNHSCLENCVWLFFLYQYKNSALSSSCVQSLMLDTNRRFRIDPLFLTICSSLQWETEQRNEEVIIIFWIIDLLKHSSIYYPTQSSH